MPQKRCDKDQSVVKFPKKVPSQVFLRAREKSEGAVECGGREVVECGGKEIEIAAPRKFHSS